MIAGHLHRYNKASSLISNKLRGADGEAPLTQQPQRLDHRQIGSRGVTGFLDLDRTITGSLVQQKAKQPGTAAAHHSQPDTMPHR